MSHLDIARKFNAALEDGNVDAARGCLHPDANIWHNFDLKEQSVDENMQLFGWMIKKAKSRHYEVFHLEEMQHGYLQRHILHIENQAGEKAKTHACAYITVENGLITRIDEYIDPAPLGIL